MNKKILIIDDHADIRRLIKMVLGSQFEVFEAVDGPTGLAKVRSLQPSLVLLDVMMPGGMDGFQVLEAIKADPVLSEIRIIMLTARGQQQDYEMGKAFGADEYFIKPFSPLRLLDAVQELLL